MVCGYDLDKLKTLARERLVRQGVAPTALNIYHLVPTIRKEQLRAERDLRMADDVIVAVDCVEDDAKEQV
jgi:hypothetical protein